MIANLRRAAWLSMALLLLSPTLAVAEDVYYSIDLHDLHATSGEINSPWNAWRQAGPTIVLDGPGEAYLEEFPWWKSSDSRANGPRVGVRAPKGKDVTGEVFIGTYPKGEVTRAKFSIPASAAKADARVDFFELKAAHYQRLADMQWAGAAWFRHQVRAADLALGKTTITTDRSQQFRRGDDLENSFELFTGGRAISENLQLDRSLVGVQGDSSPVDVASIEGIKIAPLDWKKLGGELHPEIDPLAKLIPADQHAVFFPDFNAFLRVADEAELQGTPLFRLAEPRSEDAGTVKRYERQLGLSLTGLGRVIGPQVISSLALTGSDFNFRTGTDVAIVMETAQPEVLAKLLLAQAQLASATNSNAKPVKGQAAALSYNGFRSGDRRVSCYIAELKGAVVVSNSLAQLEQLGAVSGGKAKAIAGLEEYLFFRDRYRRGDKDEAALLFISDATIRRWCGPRWRIANSRQSRDLAVMSELQAENLDALVKGVAKTVAVQTNLPLSSPSKLALDAAGVTSSTQGTLEFLTPLVEQPLTRVTRAEAQAYTRWRNSYESNWTSFDPIALRLTVDEAQLAADLSVMPLIARTEFRWPIALTEGIDLKPTSGDPHGALGHFVMALNTKSEPLRMASSFATSMGFAPKIDILGWLGESVAVYADDDPMWQELAQVDPDKVEQFMDEKGWELPVAARFEVNNGLKATLFLTGLRAFIDQTAPGMTIWETPTHNDQAFVKISMSERASNESAKKKSLAVYYLLTGDSLTVSTSRKLIERLIDRRAAGQAEPKDASAEQQAKPAPWLGKSMALRADQKLVDIFAAINRKQYQSEMRLQCWSNLPILNEWKRMYPDRDPVEVHEKVWKTRLICPDGGQYVWNDDWKTMESTVYGHPGQPKDGPPAPPLLTSFLSGDFGVTFEKLDRSANAASETQAEVQNRDLTTGLPGQFVTGLRARAILKRRPEAKPPETKP